MATPIVEDLEPILLRIAAGARVVAAAWVGILVLFGYVFSRDAMVRPWLPIVVATVVGVWSVLSVGWSASDPVRLMGVPALVGDAAVGALSLVAVALTGPGVVTFSGGLPLIVVAVASIRGRRPAWLAAVLMIGVTLVVRPGGAGEAIASIILYAAGAAIFTWVIQLLRSSDRLRREADDQRRTAQEARARAEERVEISRHLHDSVLQTLALIQRRPDTPPEVTVLARRQERELRDWLFGESIVAGAFADALGQMAADLEERHSIPVEIVSSGDAALTDRAAALISAAGEAITNAAMHSAASEVSVFAEVTDANFRIFVRDRGSGFDPERVPEDRHGVRESIIGRVTSRGGSAVVRSETGWGTEWRLEVPR